MRRRPQFFRDICYRLVRQISTSHKAELPLPTLNVLSGHGWHCPESNERGMRTNHAFTQAFGVKPCPRIVVTRKIRAAEKKSGGSFLLVHAAASKPKSISCRPRHKAFKLHGLLGLALCLLGFFFAPLAFFLRPPFFWRSSLPTSSWRLVSSWPQLTPP
jgi:hypothetical protein